MTPSYTICLVHSASIADLQTLVPNIEGIVAYQVQAHDPFNRAKYGVKIVGPLAHSS